MNLYRVSSKKNLAYFLENIASDAFSADVVLRDCFATKKDERGFSYTCNSGFLINVVDGFIPDNALKYAKPYNVKNGVTIEVCGLIPAWEKLKKYSSIKECREKTGA